MGGFGSEDWLSSGTGVFLQRRTLARDFEEEEGEKGVVVVRGSRLSWLFAFAFA